MRVIIQDDYKKMSFWTAKYIVNAINANAAHGKNNLF